LTVLSWSAYCPATSRLPALRWAAALAVRSFSLASRVLSWRISRSQNPACVARFSLKRAIWTRSVSFSASISARGFAFSTPVTNRPMKPRSRVFSRWNIVEASSGTLERARTPPATY
jgi:hypothetical protein